MNENRRYGCLLRAGSGVVEDNTFEDTTGAGVMLTNEPDWPEGPVPWSITIRHNRFILVQIILKQAVEPKETKEDEKQEGLGQRSQFTRRVKLASIASSFFSVFCVSFGHPAPGFRIIMADGTRRRHSAHRGLCSSRIWTRASRSWW